MDPIAQDKPSAATLADLRASGWRSRTVKEELRANLLERLAVGSQVFPGVVGYEESVVPSIENAILAGHDLVFLGERGQAKTRMARLLVGLLDAWLPIVRGGELNDDPLAPVSPAARAIVERDGEATPIDWLPRDRRYAEKLATPDITIADLIGEVDPIKVAEGRYLSDELTLHYGLIPRANRGIVAINELPDLAERIQVGLLNILEERDVQIRGFVVRLPLDLYMVASANPEDYTSRGRIITPLKDRLGSQIRTHYPRTLDHEMAIVRQEKHRFPVEDGLPVDRHARLHGGARRRADPPRPAIARDQPAVGRQRPRVGRQRRGPRGGGAQARGPAGRARRGAARVRPRRGGRLDRRQGRARIDRRRRTRGADRRAAHHQGAPHDVQPPRLARRAGGRRRGVRGRVHGRDRRSDAGARVRRLDARGARAARWRSIVSARSTSPTAPRSPRSSPRPSSSCSRASIWRGGSTRTACPAGRSTTGDRVLPGSTRSGAGSGARRSAAPPWRDARPTRWPARRAIPPGTAASMSPTSTPTRSSMPSPTTSWPRATWPRRSAA